MKTSSRINSYNEVYKKPELVLYDFYVSKEKEKELKTLHENKHISVNESKQEDEKYYDKNQNYDNFDKSNLIAYIYSKPIIPIARKVLSNCCSSKSNVSINEYIKEQQDLLIKNFNSSAIYLNDEFVSEFNERQQLLSIFKQLCKNSNTQIMDSRKEFHLSLLSLSLVVEKRSFDKILQILKKKHNVLFNCSYKDNYYDSLPLQEEEILQITSNESLMKSYYVSVAFTFMFKYLNENENENENETEMIFENTSKEEVIDKTQSIDHIIKIDISKRSSSKR